LHVWVRRGQGCAHLCGHKSPACIYWVSREICQELVLLLRKPFFVGEQ
jgi:hypothetical protein